MALNAEEFLGMSVDGGNATKYELIPENEEGYLAQIMPDGIGLADFTYKKGEREGQTGYRMLVKWEVQDPSGEITAQLGRPPVVTQSIMLDLTTEGALDMGKGRNVQLGRLRDAVKQNEDGKPWQPAMLIGQMARIFVKHSIGRNGEEMQDVSKVVGA